MAESSVVLTSEKINRESDELRIIKAARQDPKAFGELYMLYVEQVFRYLYSRVGNVHEAEDATAQTFLVAFESFDKFRQDGHFAFGINWADWPQRSWGCARNSSRRFSRTQILLYWWSSQSSWMTPFARAMSPGF